MHCWGHFDGTTTCPVPKDAAHPTNTESEAIKEWKHKDVTVQGLLSPRLPDRIFIRLIDHKMAKGRWKQLIEELSQPAFEDQPDAIEGVTYTHHDHVEPDLHTRQPGDLNVNTPEGVAHSEPDLMLGEEADLNASAHLEGAEPEPLMDTEEDRLLKVEEDGATGKAASVERDVGPCVELQDPGVSCLAMQEDARSLTLSSLPPPTTLEAASMQHLPAASTGTPNIPVPDHGADLEPQLPNEAMEYPIHQLPKQSQAPTKVGGLLKSLPGKELQHTIGHRGLISVWTHEGETPIREAHGHPPDFINPQMQGSTTWEPASVVLKAQVRVLKTQRPVLDKGAHTCPDLWPSLGIVIVDPDTCSGSASQLKGEQNLFSPSVGGKLHAAPPAPQHISFSPSIPIPLLSDTLMRKNPSHGEGAATEWHATKGHHPECWKPPDPQAEHLQEAGGASSALGNVPVILEGPDPLRLVGTVMDVDVREVEPSGVDTHE